MCTVTLIAQKNGYSLGMNRDEKIARVDGRPPAINFVDGRAVMFPSEPAGGTWIGANDSGVTFALINWYSVGARVAQALVSRGEVIRKLIAFQGPEDKGIARLPLARINPFRLVGVFPGQASVVEWRWNLTSLERMVHGWKSNIWISSGFDERGAQETRRAAFVAALRQGSVSDQRGLRALHSSHRPQPGPYSICMHRDDARTVSYTEVNVTASSVEMVYCPGSPCALPAAAAPQKLSICRVKSRAPLKLGGQRRTYRRTPALITTTLCAGSV